MTEVQSFSDANFHERVLAASMPVLVEAWAPFCGPCKVQREVVRQLAQELGETVRIGRLDAQNNPIFTERFGLRAVPTILIFRNGELCQQLMGHRDREEIRRALDTLAIPVRRKAS